MSQLETYGKVRLAELGHLTSVLFRLPFLVLWISAYNLRHHRKTFRRRTAASVIRWLNRKCNHRQIQLMMPHSVDAYKTWTRKHSLPRVIEELAEETTLMWIGPKRNDKVVLYVPGGAFLYPLMNCSISFWNHVQSELSKEGHDVGFAILIYSLIPTAGFPTQIRQAVLAIEHIVASGVSPSNLQLVGDTAGGQLILGLLSHIMHPLNEIRSVVPLRGRIRGVYLMSPWVSMKSNRPSSRSKNSLELIDVETTNAYANLVMAYVHDEGHVPYVDSSKAPGWWFQPLDGVVDRFFMTTGGEESMRDDIISFSQTLSRVKSNFVFTVQEGGIHADPYMDFLVGIPRDQLGSLTLSIVRWLGGGAGMALPR